MEPLVSAIIATYNREGFIAEAVNSVLHQTYRNIETIVVDDGSTDNTRKVLEKYGDTIKYVHQERSERSKARNEGFRRSKGDYIAFLDSDDMWFPKKIEMQVQILNESPDVGIVYTDVEFIDEFGSACCRDLAWTPRSRGPLYEDLMTRNVITGTTSSAMLRRTCLETVGLYDESMNTCEDLDLYRRMARYYKFFHLEKPLVGFRIHGQNTQSDWRMMAQGWEITIDKISRDTPAEFEYYRNKAILRLLGEIFRLYRQDKCMGSFFMFFAKSAFKKSNWLLRWGFWHEVLLFTWNKFVFKSEHEPRVRSL